MTVDETPPDLRDTAVTPEALRARLDATWRTPGRRLQLRP